MQFVNKFSLWTLLLMIGLLLTQVDVLAQDDDEVEPLPEITVNSSKGKRVNVVKKYADNDKISVFVFWATWCGPCKKQLDALNDLMEDWEDDYKAEIIAVSIDESEDVPKVIPLVNGRGWEFDVLLDNNHNLKRALNVATVPHTIIVDYDGDVIYSEPDYKPGEEEDLAEILKEINEEAEE